MFPRPPLSAVACLTVGLFASATLHADQDGAPVDVNKMLKELSALQLANTPQVKTLKQNALQQIGAASGSADKALGFWIEGIKATQMQGAGDEAAQFRAWRDSEGDIYKEREVQEAILLTTQWLSLTLQRASGSTVKDLLPAVINYSKALLADQAAMEALEAKIKKEREMEGGGPGPRGVIGKQQDVRQAVKFDSEVKRVHDSILRQDVSNSVLAQWYKIGGFIQTEGWEMTPGSFEGIYKNIVQPELRIEKDPRVFDYWDYKLQKESDIATKSKLTFEIDRFNNLRRPELLWNRVQEMAAIGQKNRAAAEMLNLIKTYPAHPAAASWVTALQTFLAPPAPTAPDATAPAPGTSAQPVAPPPPVAAQPQAQPFVPSTGPTPTALLPGAQ
ncbi:MAG: hypothetical protein P4L99_28760 [Chthoniobacter sp.]|nr:hypothetical protein [Chthoniobacter sp.]